MAHLACGDNYPSLSYNFRVAPNTISLIINEVCDAIKAEFAAEVIQCPTTTWHHCWNHQSRHQSREIVVCVDQGNEDNGEEALVVSVHRASIPRTGDRHMLAIQSTTTVWKLPSLLKLQKVSPS
jgi:hypothetical protein